VSLFLGYLLPTIEYLPEWIEVDLFDGMMSLFFSRKLLGWKVLVSLSWGYFLLPIIEYLLAWIEVDFFDSLCANLLFSDLPLKLLMEAPILLLSVSVGVAMRYPRFSLPHQYFSPTAFFADTIEFSAPLPNSKHAYPLILGCLAYPSPP